MTSGEKALITVISWYMVVIVIVAVIDITRGC